MEARASQRKAIGRHLKAALIATNQSKTTAAKKLSMSMRTLDRLLAGERPLELGEVEEFADKLGIPPEFVHAGFDGLPRIADIDDQLRDLRNELSDRHDELSLRFSSLTEMLAALLERRG